MWAVCEIAATAFNSMGKRIDKALEEHGWQLSSVDLNLQHTFCKRVNGQKFHWRRWAAGHALFGMNPLGKPMRVWSTRDHSIVSYDGEEVVDVRSGTRDEIKEDLFTFLAGF